jgi:hypothetical protein
MAFLAAALFVITVIVAREVLHDISTSDTEVVAAQLQ